MPNIFEMIKDYVIESEEDIPKKYRKEIEKRLNTEESLESDEQLKIISGKRGKSISREEDIAEIFTNETEMYFGHGTPGGEEVVSLIFETGLYTKSPKDAYDSHLRGLSSTTLEFGQGSKSLFENEVKGPINNWQHNKWGNKSSDIIICSIPTKYILPQKINANLRDVYGAFYHMENEHTPYKLRPEFIRGVYNSDSHTFTMNDNFYKNLPEEQQKRIFENVKKRFIKDYAEFSNFPPAKIQNQLSLSQDELEQLTIEWYKVQLERLRRDKTFQPDMLDADLHEIAGETLMSDFGYATRSIRDNAQQELEEDKDNSDEGWLLDDWE